MPMAKKILVTNDDGVYSSGIKAAYDSVKELGKATVCAPSVQKSGVGRAISLFEPLRYSRTKIPDMPAYAVGGTPTDSVIIGIFAILKEKPDLVLSGFNIGENVSTDAITTSGTIGAAMEAASYGIPTIAASIQVPENGIKFDDLRGYHTEEFKVAVDEVHKIAKKLLKHKMPEGVDFLNINIPYMADENTEIEITRLGRKIFKTSVEERHDPRGRPYYWITGDLIENDARGTDVHAIMQNKNISVTPVSLDSTAVIELSEIEKLL